VSPLWPDRLQIGLAPRRVEIARLRRRLRATTVESESERDFEPSTEAGQSPWSGALAALEVLLAEQPAGRAEVRVVLSNHFAHYLALPWEAALSDPAEVTAAAEQQFEHVYGEAAQGWDIRLCQPAWGEPGIACAVDRGLVAGIREKVGDAGGGSLRLASIEPLLMVAYNAVCERLDGDGALVVAEDSCACIATFRGRRWHKVLSRHGRSLALPRVISQELALATADAAPSRIDFVDVGADCNWAPEDSVPVQRHEQVARLCTLALAGVA
jgi:hypothetical protein